MPSTITTEEQVAFHRHEFDHLDVSQSDVAFSADTYIASSHQHDDDHHLFLQKSFAPPKKQNCDAVSYYCSIMDSGSLFVPVTKQPSCHHSHLRRTNSYICESSDTSDIPNSKQFIVTSHDVAQRRSLSDLHSQYWELLKSEIVKDKNLSRKPLISQIAKGMTVNGEENDVKTRIAALLGKDKEDSLGPVQFYISFVFIYNKQY